uniref:B30.2/SPRY domain-containing protein n=1 Tax=Sparus aurata TaxID=8175 RepID=A0A671Z2N6_SPAAU
MIQSRSKKIVEIETSVDVGQKEAEKEKDASVQVFTDLIRSIQRSQAELVGAIEERYRATKLKAEGFLTELKTEISELESRRKQLEQLSQSEDHLHFVQSFQTLCSPVNKDWSNTGVHSDLCFETVRSAMTRLKERVDELVGADIRMKRMREHAVDLTFDPDTAYCSLVISQDGKQVKARGTKQKVPDNPKRFETCAEVLAKEGFTTGKFYYEVQVKGQISWSIGVVRESIDRKKDIPMSDDDGYWTIGLDEGIYEACTSSSVKLTLKEELQKVGVFVDYNKGSVSFYNADSKSHIYSYTGYKFKEKLYPYFGLQSDSTPFIITPSPETH